MAVACDSLFPRAEAFYIIKNAKAIKRGEKPLSSFGAKALDASTFVVELNHPSPYFLNLISTTFFAPFQEGKQEVGNGPFRVKSKEPGASITLEKNPNYWDASSVRLEEVTAYFVDDAETGLMLFEKGEVDWVGSPFRHLPLDAIPHLRASQELHTLPVSIVYWLSVNTKDPLLSNVKLRRALSLALDREKLVEGVLVEQVPSFSVIPTNLRDKTPTNSFVKEDPLLVFEEALEELKLTRQELSPLVLKHSNVPGQKKLCEALQQVWEETFKIKIQLQGADWNTFFSDLQGRQFQIGGCLWRSLYDDPMGILEFFKEGKSPYNPSGWENQEYKRLLTLADNEVDERQREHHLKHAEALLFCDVPVIPLYSELFKYAKKEYVKGVYITNGGDVDLKNAFIAP